MLRRFVAFVLEQYQEGRSLREIAELTDRSFSAIRNILDTRGVQRRPPGAQAMTVDGGKLAP
jgi:predicted HTH domain antitoxin